MGLFDLAITFALVVAPAAAAFAASGPTHRVDLSPAFISTLCSDQTDNLPFATWANGVHDAQIEGRFTPPVSGLPVDERLLAHRARSMAVVHGHGGYAYGVCPDGRGWALALPAPSPLLTSERGRLKVPTEALAERCESVRADFAPRATGSARVLKIERGAIATAGLGDGVVSVTCQPKSPRWRGPVLWYLTPVGSGPDRAPPAIEALTGELTPLTALGPWINRVRANAGLKALAVSAELVEQASLLSVDGSLTHDRLLLKKAAASLDERQIRLLGEDRVKGRDGTAMAWLLWNSPRHRELILNADATALGVAGKVIGDETLAVVVVGTKAPLKAAKAGGPGQPHL